MVSLSVKSRLTYLIAGLVIFFSLFALWLRLIPMFSLGHADILSAVGSDDPLYNLRQVEQILANFPNYAWFDPMTYFPTGSAIYWGPLFPTIIAVACLLTGAVTRPEIIATGLVIPPLMAAATVAIMYFVGKNCGDWKTGLFASGFTAVVSGQFFYRSLYGYMDHHIGEVLFSTIFCLFYMYTIFAEKDANIDLKNFSTYKRTVLLSILTGVAYLLGFFLMPTMILFAMIVGIFTIIQFVIDVYRNRTSEYLLIINSDCFCNRNNRAPDIWNKDNRNKSLRLFCRAHLRRPRSHFGNVGVLSSRTIPERKGTILFSRRNRRFVSFVFFSPVRCPSPDFQPADRQPFCILRAGRGDEYGPGSTGLGTRSGMGGFQLRTNPDGRGRAGDAL